ncbi:hypothetical protein C1645_825413, partial [Glomus cerebriforme]
RLLNFNNLPEPKNADDEEEYSNSTIIDFTKLNINPQDEHVQIIVKLEMRRSRDFGDSTSHAPNERKS